MAQLRFSWAPRIRRSHWSPDGLKAKIAAGAQFAQTQFCMDIDIVRRYMARLADEGITEKLFILIGIAPLASARSARWIRDNLRGSIIPDQIVDRLETASDPKQEGRRICVELMEQFAEVPGIAGAHIMAPLNDSAIPAVIKDFRKIHSA
jgi:methylenetetrahydrofolate reductase (NADPH)